MSSAKPARSTGDMSVGRTSSHGKMTAPPLQKSAVKTQKARASGEPATSSGAKMSETT